MNPLSITASTLTVIQAVGVVTIGVGTFVHSLRTIDSRLTGLYDELSDLQGNLKTIENTLIGCKDIDLSLIDDAIWHQSEIAIGNCQATVNDLARLVDKIKEASKPGTIGWKVQAIFELKVHERDLAGFRDKVHQSNSALQTMLHIIVVSLSLRQNASQSQILTELNSLKQSINNTWNASSKPIGDRRNSMSGNRLDNNITRDLRHLAAAAETFYATASSTAGTLKSDDGKSILNSFVGSEASGAGDLPYLRYQLLEQYLHNLHSGHPSSVSSYPSRKTPFKSELIIEGPTMIETANKTSTETKHKPHHPDSSAFNVQKEEVDDSYFEDVILAGMRELAIASIKALDFDEAIRLIKEVVCDGFETKRRNFDYFETFSQLILCYFFKGEWRLAEPLVNLLSESYEKRPDPSHELVIYNFSHALALCYLAEYSFERALEYCKRALYGKRRLFKVGQADGREYEETLGLYATIYEVSGDCMRAEIFRRQLLAKSIYIHPENVVVFFQGHEKLLASILGSDDIQTLTGALLTSTAELAASPTDITHGEVPAKISGDNILRTKLTRHEMLERDTAKEAVVDTLRSPYEADDESSPTGTTTINPQSPKEKSPIRRHLTRIFKPRSSRLDTFGSAGRDEGDLPMINGPSTMKPSSRFRLFSHRGPSLKNSRTQRRGHAEIAISDEMGRTTCSQGTSTAHTGQRILDCVQETADHTSVDEFRNSDSGSHGTRGQQLKASSHLESVDTSRHELGDTSLPAELGDTSPPDQTINTLEATECEEVYEKLDNIIEPDEDSHDESTALDPELTSERPPATQSDPQTSHSPADSNGHDAKSVGIDSNLNISREEQPRDLSSRFEHCRAELWFGDKWAQALQNITSQLAIHLSSINGNQDLNSLQYHNQALTELFPSFKALSSDPNMVNDIRVAMFTLRKKIKELPQGHEDSGYESSQNSRDKGTASIDSTETKLRRWIRPCHPPASRNTDYAQTQENAQTQEKVQSPHPTADHSLETVCSWREFPSNLLSSNEQPEIPSYHRSEKIGADNRIFAGIDAPEVQVPDIEHPHNTSMVRMGTENFPGMEDNTSGIKEGQENENSPPITLSLARTHLDEPVKILPRLRLSTSHHTEVTNLGVICPSLHSDKRQGSLFKDEDDIYSATPIEITRRHRLGPTYIPPRHGIAYCIE